MRLYLHERHRTRRAPVEFRDAAERFARQFGGHADVVWGGDQLNCWAVRFTLKPGDPRLAHPDESTHYEQVLLHEFVDPAREPTHPKLDRLPENKWTGQKRPGYVAFDLDELGVSGLLEVLQRTSLLSGRGEHSSAPQALKAIRERNEALKRKRKIDARSEARDVAAAVRRRVFKIPFLSVGIDLTPNT